MASYAGAGEVMAPNRDGCLVSAFTSPSAFEAMGGRYCLAPEVTFNVSPALQRSTSASSGKSVNSRLSAASTVSGSMPTHPSAEESPSASFCSTEESGEGCEVLVSLLHTALRQGQRSGGGEAPTQPTSFGTGMDMSLRNDAEPCMRRAVQVSELHSLKERLAASLKSASASDAADESHVAELMSLKKKLASRLQPGACQPAQPMAVKPLYESRLSPTSSMASASAMLYNGVAYVARR